MRTKVITSSSINAAVMRLDSWLDTMRGPNGYGGPVAHWWQQSLIYTGAGLDWRYEGIIEGYLQLWARTGEQEWLRKACRAGDDLLKGQLPSGHYAASSFEINPASAGTPHEAACDVGLLLLAQVLQQQGDVAWKPYAACAKRNLRLFYVKQLWDMGLQCVRDDADWPMFVPNKAATACEAFFLLTELTEDALWVERYALPTLEQVLNHQVRDGSRFDGAIAQNSLGLQRVEKYFPIYIARCIPALLRAYCWAEHERYLVCALKAMRFIVRWMRPDGSLPTVIYPNRQVNRYPNWIAPLGDVLYAAHTLRAYGFEQDVSPIHQRLLAGQDASGGIQTARGFAAQASNRLPELPDVRDILHVVGWCDKAFRYLTSQIDSNLPLAAHSVGNPSHDSSADMTFEADCTFQGQRMHYQETPDIIEISSKQDVCYRWRKGNPWAEIAREEFWLK